VRGRSQETTGNLSENFTLEEFTRSDLAERWGWDNTPNDDQIEALRALCLMVLQPVRDWYEKPLVVNSGFRCATLNKAVKGAPNSQHMKGEAADVTVGYDSDGRGYLLPLMLYAIEAELPFDQAILYPGSHFIHFSHKRPESGTNRREVLVKENGGYVSYDHASLRNKYGSV